MLNVTAKHTKFGTLEVLLDGRRLMDDEAPTPRLQSLGAEGNPEPRTPNPEPRTPNPDPNLNPNPKP